MRNELESLLVNARPTLNSCPECPIKGTCVFVTPEYEPGYCLHEYKLLHAFVANRLRAHPPAGAAGFARLADQVAEYATHLTQTRPYDPARFGADLRFDRFDPQVSLFRYGVVATPAH